MGRCERVCAGCSSAWTEYDDYFTCSECHRQYFVDCGCSSEVTSLVGIGLVCDNCNNYNIAGAATTEQLYYYLLAKYELENEEVYREWAVKQETRTLPCFRCKSETCKATHENQIHLTEKEIEDMDSFTDMAAHFGQCCICAEKENMLKGKKCDICSANKRIKL
jgi:hypothetical protein